MGCHGPCRAWLTLGPQIGPPIAQGAASRLTPPSVPAERPKVEPQPAVGHCDIHKRPHQLHTSNREMRACALSIYRPAIPGPPVQASQRQSDSRERAAFFAGILVAIPIGWYSSKCHILGKPKRASIGLERRSRMRKAMCFI